MELNLANSGELVKIHLIAQTPAIFDFRDIVTTLYTFGKLLSTYRYGMLFAVAMISVHSL